MNSRHGYLDVNKNSDKSNIVPVFLDNEGNVAETSGSTIFAIKGNVIKTPPLSSPILKSITRHFILKEIASSLKEYSFKEMKISKKDLKDSDEIFLAGTNAEVTSVTHLDNIPLSSNYITKLIHKTFSKSIKNLIS